jgi:hypothetical protein
MSETKQSVPEGNKNFSDDLDTPTEPMIPVVLVPHPLAPSSAVPAQQDGQHATSRPAPPQRSMIPTVVGVCFVVIQVLLLVRVLLLLFTIGSNTAWARILLTPGGAFAFPMRLLLEHIQVVAQLGAGVIMYLAPLLSILIYGLISRFLVRFLKALLNA